MSKLNLLDRRIEGVLSREGEGYLLDGVRLDLDQYLGQGVVVVIHKVVEIPSLEVDAWRNHGDG
jgi:hypothetical protein